jgi:hypothetical protein
MYITVRYAKYSLVEESTASFGLMKLVEGMMLRDLNAWKPGSANKGFQELRGRLFSAEANLGW